MSMRSSLSGRPHCSLIRPRVSVAGEPPEVWEHWELYASDGSAPERFAFFWAAIPDEVPPLFAEADPALLHYLQRCI